MWFCPWGNVITKRCSEKITWLLLSRLQGKKSYRNSPGPSETLELSGTLRILPPWQNLRTFWNLPPEPRPAHTETVRNLPPEPALRNLPPEPAPAIRTGTHRSLSGLKTPLAYAVGKKMRFPYYLLVKNQWFEKLTRGTAFGGLSPLLKNNPLLKNPYRNIFQFLGGRIAKMYSF